MSRREWIRLILLMTIVVALGLIITFIVGDNGGTPTQRLHS